MRRKWLTFILVLIHYESIDQRAYDLAFTWVLVYTECDIKIFLFRERVRFWAKHSKYLILKLSNLLWEKIIVL